MKDYVLEHWRENIDDMVENGDVLYDYDDPEDLTSAKRTLVRFVEGEHAEYAITFSKREIEDVVNKCAVSRIVSNNKESRLNHAQIDWSPDSTKDVYDAEAITDLFER